VPSAYRGDPGWTAWRAVVFSDGVVGYFWSWRPDRRKASLDVGKLSGRPDAYSFYEEARR
jgi:hypothetical protein